MVYIQLFQQTSKGGSFLQQLDGLCGHKKNDLLPHIYNFLETCRARIVLMSSSTMVFPYNEKDQRSPVVRGETVAASGAKPAASAQPRGVLPGGLYYYQSYFSKVDWIDRLFCCSRKPLSSQLPPLPQMRISYTVEVMRLWLWCVA